MNGSAAGIAITGGSGAVGRALVRLLSAQGAPDIRVIDTATPPADTSARHHAVSVLDREALGRSFAGCRVVVHLAGLADAGACAANPDRCREINVGGTAAAAAAAAGAGVARFVLASTVYVYGESGHGVKEDAPLAPQSVYARTKAEAEAAARAVSPSVAVTIARLSNVYGPAVSSTTVLATACRQIAAGGHVSLRSFAPARDFIFVDDVAGALGRILDLPRREPLSAYNIGTGRLVTVGEAAAILKELAAAHGLTPALRELEPGRAGGPVTALVPDVSALEALGWRAETPLRAGLRHTLSHWMTISS